MRSRVTRRNLDAAWRYAAVMDRLRDIWRDDLAIAEIGSGSGGLSEFVDHPITGVDEAFDRTAEAINPQLRQVPGSAGALPLADASFDVVLSLEMLEHLGAQERESALREMLRVVRPGGRVIVTFPSGPGARHCDRWLNEQYRRRHGVEHPWVAEHLEHGVPDADEVARVVAPLARETRVEWQAWAPAWRLVHRLYTLDQGYPWTRLAGIHTEPGARVLFSLLRRLNRGECYRAMLVIER